MADPVESLPEPMRRKVGPLPVAGWVVVAIVGVMVGSRLVRRFRPSQPDETAAAEDVGSSYDTSLPALDGAGPSTGLGEPTAKFADNAQWKAAAFAALLAQGHAPVAAENALQRYLERQTLTQAEAAMIDAALQAVGLPPHPLPGATNVAPPPAEQPTNTEPQNMPGLAEIQDMARRYQAGQVTEAEVLTWAAQFGQSFVAQVAALLAQYRPQSPQTAPPPVPAVTGPATATQPAQRQPDPAPAAPARPAEAAPPYTVTRGSTLWAQAQRVYGRVNKGIVQQVAAYNGIHFDGYYVTPWQVGQVVRWPVI